MKPFEKRIVRFLLRDWGRTFAEGLGIDLMADDPSGLVTPSPSGPPKVSMFRAGQHRKRWLVRLGGRE